MRVLAIIHQSDAGLGVFAEAIEAAGARIDEWYPARQPNPPPELRRYGAVITLGGAMHADQEREHRWLPSEKQMLGRLLDAGMPLLGVCLGGQLLAEAAGGDVRRAGAPEIGWYDVHKTAPAEDDALLGPLPPRFRALEWHSYEFFLPPGATALARSERCLQAFRIADAAWGIQFHAEVAPADLESWIDDYRSDPDAIAAGLDAQALRAGVREAIAGWNQFGRDLVRRFLTVAAGR